MPKDTIKRALDRGTGNVEGLSYEELCMEGYGPSGVADGRGPYRQSQSRGW